jgi:membrane-associated protein
MSLLELFHAFIDIVLHLDKHLTELIAAYHYWVYGILFLIIFAETGLVVTPFLPGDSLLFAVGALSAVDQTGTLSPVLLWLLLVVAAVLGNETNFRIGGLIGPRAFSGQFKWLKQQHLNSTHAFFEKHGNMAIVLSRFLPILRTFTPFVAGVGKMNAWHFHKFNLLGGFSWVSLFIWGGYVFGNVPLVKNNFGIVTISIVVITMIPLAWAAFKSWRGRS